MDSQDSLAWLGVAHTDPWSVRIVPQFVASAGEAPRYVVETCRRFPDGWHLGYLIDHQGLRRTFATLDAARESARAFLAAPDPAGWQAA